MGILRVLAMKISKHAPLLSSQPGKSTTRSDSQSMGITCFIDSSHDKAFLAMASGPRTIVPGPNFRLTIPNCSMLRLTRSGIAVSPLVMGPHRYTVLIFSIPCYPISERYSYRTYDLARLGYNLSSVSYTRSLRLQIQRKDR